MIPKSRSSLPCIHTDHLLGTHLASLGDIGSMGKASMAAEPGWKFGVELLMVLWVSVHIACRAPILLDWWLTLSSFLTSP